MSHLKKFEIWVELDIIEDQHVDEEFCNAILLFSDGSKIGINIWSEKFFYQNFKNFDWINEQVAILPDIVVRDFNASSIRQAIFNLVTKQNWLEGRGFPARREEMV
ncbi:hypothetical protein I8748_07135 [Nostoc sp. CENA67]|uniref:Uncharacterized protein n=1 Tax=Amazonocrinis nigriterrae CENA67 TaxID=2794033 RepID=A0A8J7HR57_9NOST|nr:hypothetical protein [Amazonocrinis nigriterrae]MBH8561947.1 hypothetical protein [Amazonocrinis nigriterrae CENA67]